MLLIVKHLSISYTVLWKRWHQSSSTWSEGHHPCPLPVIWSDKRTKTNKAPDPLNIWSVLKEYPTTQIGKIKFVYLRPKHVLLSKKQTAPQRVHVLVPWKFHYGSKCLAQKKREKGKHRPHLFLKLFMNYKQYLFIYIFFPYIFQDHKNAIFTGGINKLGFSYFGQMMNVSLDHRGAKWPSMLSYIHQDGHFPTSRLGHSLNKVGNGHLLLFGGLEHQFPDSTCASSAMFADKTPAMAYSYNIECGSWLQSEVHGEHPPDGRTYHSITEL